MTRGPGALGRSAETIPGTVGARRGSGYPGRVVNVTPAELPGLRYAPGPPSPAVAAASPAKISVHSPMHSAQMYTPGPATSGSPAPPGLPQNERIEGQRAEQMLSPHITASAALGQGLGPADGVAGLGECALAVPVPASALRRANSHR